MTKLKIKNKPIFWIAVFSILVQVWGQTENTATSSCGGVLELSSGALDFSPVGQNEQNLNQAQDFCIWVIKLPVPSETIQFQMTQIPQSSQLNIYSQEGHVAGQISVLPIASLTTADIHRSIDTNSSTLVVIWTPSRVKNEVDESNGLLSFTWDEVSAQGQRSGQIEEGVDQTKDLNMYVVGGVNYVEADRGRFSWVKPGKRQQTLLWVLNSKSAAPLDLKIETDLENCDLMDPCLCSYFGVYEVRDNFLRAVSTECGRSWNLQYNGVGPRLVALGFVNPDFRADPNHVTLSWNDKELEEGTTTTTPTTTTESTSPTTTTTTDISTTEEQQFSTTEEEQPTTSEPPKTCASVSEYPKSCSDFQFESGSIGNSSQLESCSIYPDGPGYSLEVLCDFEVDGGGWTLIQKRSSGPREEFNRTWIEYANGFGSVDGNFWLGLKNIRTLTKNGDQELRIDLEGFYGEKRWAKYSNFSVSDASDFYRLNVSGFSVNSTAGDSMINSAYGSENILNGMRFGTWDRDNDLNSNINCVERHGGGGWWFRTCSFSHLNGPYRQNGEDSSDRKGIFWYSWKDYETVAKTEVKIRTKKFESE